MTQENNFVKTRIDNETVEYRLNGEVLITANHDDDGWSGMERIDDLISSIARKLGAEISEVEAD